MPGTKDELICYCFGRTRADIETDFLRHGRSTILEHILEAKRRSGCHCVEMNPSRG